MRREIARVGRAGGPHNADANASRRGAAGWVAVTTLPTTQSVSVATRLWTWVRPFTSSVWVTLACTLVAVGLVMTWLERWHNGARARACSAPDAAQRRDAGVSARGGLGAQRTITGTS